MEKAKELFLTDNTGKYVGYLQKDCILKPEEHDNKSCIYAGAQNADYWLCEKAGSSYTVDYNLQNDSRCQYAIGLGNSSDIEKELTDTVVTLTIQYDDGRTLQKYIHFEMVPSIAESFPVKLYKILVTDRNSSAFG